MADDADATSDIVSLKRRIEALEREIEVERRDAGRWRALMAAQTLSIGVYTREGHPVALNAGWEQFWGLDRNNFLKLGYNVRRDPQLVSNGVAPFIERTYQGESLSYPRVDYDPLKFAGMGSRQWVSTFGVPVPDAGGHVEEAILLQFSIPEAAEIDGKYTQLLAEQQLLRASLEQRNQELETQLHLIESQQDAIQALRVPVIRVGEGVLCLPIVGVIDDIRASELLERLLEAITAQQATEVIIDITGVPAVDAQAASHLVSAASAARLVGAECALVGISPSIARTLVEIGVDLGSLSTHSTLAEGLSRAQARLERKARPPAGEQANRQGAPGSPGRGRRPRRF